MAQPVYSRQPAQRHVASAEILKDCRSKGSAKLQHHRIALTLPHLSSKPATQDSSCAHKRSANAILGQEGRGVIVCRHIGSHVGCDPVRESEITGVDVWHGANDHAVRDLDSQYVRSDTKGILMRTQYL